MQHAETMRKADEHRVYRQLLSEGSALHHRPQRMRCAAVDLPSTVVETKAETIRIIASPPPEGPRQRARGG
jgi:hypothetical protein